MNELAGLLLEASWRVVPPALVAALAVLLLRRRSPLAAHAIGSVMLAGMLLLPLLVAAGPRWPVPLPAARFAESVFAEVPQLTPFSASGPSAATPARATQPRAVEPGGGGPGLRWGMVYGLGLTILLCRFLMGLWLARRLRQGCRELVHPRLAGLARELLPGRTVTFCSSGAVRVPFTTGLLRPRVFLPPDWESWREEALRGAVGHELCHVRRRDYAWSVLAELNRCLYWFHPLAWVLPRQLSRLADRISDELAASAMASATGYARLLVEMAERIPAGSGRLVRAAPALPMVGTGGLAERVEALLSQPRRRRPSPRWTGAAAGLAMTGIFGVLLLSAAIEVGAASNPRGSTKSGPDELVAALASADPETRAAAAFDLARRPGGEEAAIPHLLRLLGDDARIAAPRSWSFLQDGWMPARRVWQHPSPGEAAAIGLASFGRRSARPLLTVLESADPVVRRNAAWALGEIRQPRGIPEEGLAALVRTLRDPDAGVRAAAAWAAGDIRIEAAVPELMRIMRRDSSFRARAEAAKALGEIRDPAAVAELEVAHRSERHPAVLWAIRGALAELR